MKAECEDDKEGSERVYVFTGCVLTGGAGA
jgi:hypothetical protein